VERERDPGSARWIVAGGGRAAGRRSRPPSRGETQPGAGDRPHRTTTDPPLPFPTGYDEHLTEIRRKESQDYLDDIAEPLREGGLTVGAAAVVAPSAAGALLDLARPGRAGLVVIASHGQGGLRRLALGSVADKLVRAAEVPVVVVWAVKKTRV
jgi:nucleotide-binding universal stress UspA family protein